MDVPIAAYGLLAIIAGTLVVTVVLIIWACRRDREDRKKRGFDHDEPEPGA